MAYLIIPHEPRQEFYKDADGYVDFEEYEFAWNQWQSTMDQVRSHPEEFETIAERTARETRVHSFLSSF